VPALTVTPADMVAAAQARGAKGAVEFHPDSQVHAVVDGWPRPSTSPPRAFQHRGGHGAPDCKQPLAGDPKGRRGAGIPRRGHRQWPPVRPASALFFSPVRWQRNPYAPLSHRRPIGGATGRGPPQVTAKNLSGCGALFTRGGFRNLFPPDEIRHGVRPSRGGLRPVP